MWVGVKDFQARSKTPSQSRCDARWKGRPAFSQVHGIWRKWCCNRLSNRVGIGALGHVSGRGHLAIPAHPVTLHLTWMAALSFMPPSSLPASIDVHLGPWGASRVSARASSAFRALCFHTAILPSQRQAKWSFVLNYSWTLIAVTRCPVMTQDAIQFSGAFFVGSVRAMPACFTGRRVTPLPGVPSPRAWKRSGTKASCRAYFAGAKAFPMSGVTRCMNAHYCLSDFCSTA